MADADFYNRNLFRRYPLVDETNSFAFEFPEAVFSQFVDFGIVLYPGSGFNLADPTHRIFLGQWGGQTSSGKPDLGFTLYAPGAAVDGKRIIVVNSANVDFSFVPFQLYVDSSTLNLTDGVGQFVGYGFIVFGYVNSFSPVGAEFYDFIINAPDSNPPIERRCIQSATGHFVNKFVVANELRTTTKSQGAFNSSNAAVSTSAVVAPGGDPVDGDVRFKEGYNCVIRVLSRNNALRFSARRGAGAGVACEEIPRTEAELALASRGLLLDGATRCYEAFSSINGIQPDLSGNFTIQSGKGVSIDSPAVNTIRLAGRDSMEECGNIIPVN